MTRCVWVAIFAVSAAFGQGGRGGSPLMREGTQLDLDGKYAEAQKVFQKAIDEAPNAAAKAQAQRSMAMSYAFAGDCKNTVKYEDMVFDYWKTREAEEPQNAFYQEGEMANEAARVCIDLGDLDTAERMYRKGREAGLKEPNITGRKDLWEFRTEHALARLAARHGNKPEAEKHIALAKAALAHVQTVDAPLYQQQTVFLPYLIGYVDYYTGNYKSALENLEKANTSDPFVQCMIGMTYEKLGDAAKAKEAFTKASTTTAHNPPAAFAKPFAVKKLK